MAEPTIFDSHVHILAADRQAYPMRAGDALPEGFQGSAEWLVRLMDEHGVLGALLVQGLWYGEGNRYFLDSVRRFPGRFAILGHLPDPFAPDAADKLTRQFQEESCRGMRIRIKEDWKAEGVAAGRADPLIRRAGELGVPIQILTHDVRRQPLVLDLVRRFPDTKFVIDHLGFPEIAESYPYPSSASFFACGPLPNCYAKVSCHGEFSQESYPWADLRPFQQLTLDAFGPRRLMWGSNYPMLMDKIGYGPRLDVVRRDLPFLSEDERAWILGQTALTLWQPL
ncbi:MAG: amidohydrolase family protein [Chloroflexota bacterium]